MRVLRFSWALTFPFYLSVFSMLGAYTVAGNIQLDVRFLPFLSAVYCLIQELTSDWKLHDHPAKQIETVNDF